MRVTLDTNILPAEALITQAGAGFEFAVVSVTTRELASSPFAIHLTPLGQIPEVGVFGDSTWGEFVWAGEGSKLESILDALSNGGFPAPTARTQLTNGQRRLMRDAMILEAHLRESRDLFVTNDKKAFVNGGRRELLRATFGARIMTEGEFREYLTSRGVDPAI